MTKVGTDEGLGDIDLMESYDELLEDRRIEEKKKQVEAERKQELAEREKELETLNQNDDIGTDRITLN